MKRFLTWLMSLTILLRCFVIALLVHAALLLILGSIKVTTIAIIAIQAAFDGGQPPPVSVDDPDPFKAYREVDYNPPGLKGLPPPVGTKMEVATAGAKASIKSLTPEVIGVVDDNALAGVRLQGVGVGSILTSPFGGGESLVGVIGGTGKGPWDGRFGPQRVQNMNKHQSSQEAERSVLAALRWLKNNQSEDGSWSINGNKDAGTALSVLCFLGHGHTADDKEFGDAVNRGLTRLMNNVGSDG